MVILKMCLVPIFFLQIIITFNVFDHLNHQWHRNHSVNHLECEIVNVWARILHSKKIIDDKTAGTSAEAHLVWSCLRVTLWWIRQS